MNAFDDPDVALNDLFEFVASRGFVHNHQQSTARGFLAVINVFHKMFTGWELPTSNCMILAAEKGIDRAHGMSKRKETAS